MDSSQSDCRKRAKKKLHRSASIRRISVYDAAFEHHFIDHGIYSEGYGDVRNIQEPPNWKKINARLALLQAFLSSFRFTREKFLDFKEKSQKALIETKLINNVLSIIAGTAGIPSQ